MELIILGGNGVQNRSWIREVAKRLRKSFNKIYTHNYDHWKTGKELIDLDYELNKIVEYLNNKEEYIIIAKSVGAILTIKGICENKIFPKKCVILGLPLSWAIKNRMQLDVWIKGFSTPTLFIQNKLDPLMSSKELKNFLEEEKVINFLFYELNGNTHEYDNVKEIYQIILDFCVFV